MSSLREAAMLSLFSSQPAARKTDTHDRKKPEDRKNELLDIAIRLFLRRGYENTSVKDIFTEANGSFGMFYHHFKSKETIFAAAMDKFAGLFTESLSDILLDQKIPFKERYDVAINHYSSFLRGIDKLKGRRRAEPVNTAFKTMNLKMVNESVRPIQLFIEEGMREGLVHTSDSGMAATFIAYGIWGSIHEESIRASNYKNAPSLLSQLSGIIARVLDADPSYF